MLVLRKRGINMNSDKLYKESLKELEHYEKYENFPLEQTPNFYLKRTLTEYEMEQVKLIALCECKDKKQYDNFMRTMVLEGPIKELLKKAKKAHKQGYYEFYEYTIHAIHETILLESGLEKRVPFPPKMKEYQK